MAGYLNKSVENEGRKCGQCKPVFYSTAMQQNLCVQSEAFYLWGLHCFQHFMDYLFCENIIIGLKLTKFGFLSKNELESKKDHS